MYLVAIAWLYVAVMMALAEATHAQGSVLGAVITFLLYGLGPVALVMYLLGTPGRLRARKLEQQLPAGAPSEEAAQAGTETPPAEVGEAAASAARLDPEGRGHAPGVAVKPGVAPE